MPHRKNDELDGFFNLVLGANPADETPVLLVLGEGHRYRRRIAARRRVAQTLCPIHESEIEDAVAQLRADFLRDP